ncbi:MAG: hypothetical protein IT219_12395, partial [Bacteroidales bacterium]|nr:hypothetical protein [Bacteroidales bacterium]
MKKLLRIFSVIAFTAASHFAQAQSATQVSITGTGGAYSIPNNSATVVDNGIVVTANGNITDFTVSITGSYTNLDILGYSGALPVGITAAAFNAATRSIQFFGTASPTVWQELLRRVTLTTTSAVCFPEQRQVSFVVGNTFFNPLNHHFYKLVSAGKSWITAQTDAANTSFFGYQGYLATISSQAENNFIGAFINNNSWIGCSDNYKQINNAVNYTKYSNQSNAEGKFHWVTGPEKGTQMRTGNAAGGNLGANIAGVYSNWQNSEPNDYPNSG